MNEVRNFLTKIKEPFIFIGGSLLIIGVLSFFAWHDPEKRNVLPPCPVFFLTGLYCPGCGTSRALHALLHGKIVKAIGFNVLTFSSVPFFLYVWVRYGIKVFSGKLLFHPLSGRYAGYIILAVLLVFTVLRNIPVFSFLAP